MKKRKVTMTSVVYAGKDDDGNDLFHRHEAVDYVSVEPHHPDHLEKYVADARTRWQHVEVDPDPIDHDDEYAFPEHITRGVSLDDHLDSLGIPNRTDEHGNVMTPKGA